MKPLAAAPAALLAACLACAAAGCGSAPVRRVAQLGTTATRSSASGRGSTRDQALAYARCIRAHGVPLWPDPDASGVFAKSALTPQKLGVGTTQIGRAQRACASLVPTYSAARQSHVLAEALRFSRCMRAHGAPSFPDPESNGAIRIPDAMESSPAYLAALRHCVRRYGVPPPPSPAG